MRCQGIVLPDPALLARAVNEAGKLTQPNLEVPDPTSLVEVVNEVVRTWEERDG